MELCGWLTESHRWSDGNLLQEVSYGVVVPSVRVWSIVGPCGVSEGSRRTISF